MDEDNVNLSSEEQIKQKKKDKINGAKSIVAESDSARVEHKGGKEKKKTKKSKGAKDAEADTENGSRKGELTVASGENDAERNGESSSGVAVDNAEGKRKHREKKDRNEKFEMHDTEEGKRDESSDCQEGESVYGKESVKEVIQGKKKKKQKVKRNGSMVGEKDGDHSENCMVNAAVIVKETKKNKKKRKDDSFAGSKGDGLSSKRQENALPQSTKEDGDTKTNRERKKNKKQKEKERCKDDLPAAQQEDVDNDTNGLLNAKDTTENNEAELTNKRKKKKKKTKVLEDGSNGELDNKAEYAKKGNKRKASLVAKGSDDNSPNKSNKKVRFSDKDEVFPVPPKSNTEEGNGNEYNLIGKRFTHAEDEILKDAVMQYIEDHELGDKGLEMILHCSKHPEVKGCWKEIASSLPSRRHDAIYNRARILFMRSESRKWTQEEYDIILKYQEVHGNQWRPLADELGKHAWHVKDTWRRIKLRDAKKGHWAQQEYQKLFDLVNLDLQLKLSEEKKSKHGMLRDNIAWGAISDELSTRPQSSCCLKWYKQLTSPMVAQGVWADSDDYRLLSALYSLDATCVEDVEWGDLIEGRAGDICRKRWNQMCLHLGHNGNKSFAEQVEVLAQRYCPHLLEAREIWDNKPRVP